MGPDKQISAIFKSNNASYKCCFPDGTNIKNKKSSYCVPNLKNHVLDIINRINNYYSYCVMTL